MIDRSIIQPRLRKFHPSSRGMVSLATPATAWHAVLTKA